MAQAAPSIAQCNAAEKAFEASKVHYRRQETGQHLINARHCYHIFLKLFTAYCDSQRNHSYRDEDAKAVFEFYRDKRDFLQQNQSYCPEEVPFELPKLPQEIEIDESLQQLSFNVKVLYNEFKQGLESISSQKFQESIQKATQEFIMIKNILVIGETHSEYLPSIAVDLVKLHIVSNSLWEPQRVFSTLDCTLQNEYKQCRFQSFYKERHAFEKDPRFFVLFDCFHAFKKIVDYQETLPVSQTPGEIGEAFQDPAFHDFASSASRFLDTHRQLLKRLDGEKKTWFYQLYDQYHHHHRLRSPHHSPLAAPLVGRDLSLLDLRAEEENKN